MRCVIYLRVSTAAQAERDLTEEGFSIPAQRDACVARIREQDWTLVDEYVDRGESARSTDRPQLQAMLARLAEVGDVDAVVVHKIDRLARNMEDHVAIRAAFRHAGVTLVSVTENLEDTASGKLVEGIHALMADFYSANLASEIRKGMRQKAKLGGWPYRAPIGYINVRETIDGRTIARIIPDAERAPLITLAFQLYATGEYTLHQLADELDRRGLRSRSKTRRPLSLNGISTLLHNPAYLGKVTYQGVEHDGAHQPLIDQDTFHAVQQLLASRTVRGTRERTHDHHLKGLLHCAVCDHRMSIDTAKGQRYRYFFCAGQKRQRNRPPTGCREPYAPTDRVEVELDRIYQRLQLPDDVVARIETELADEIATRQRRTLDERDRHHTRLAALATERHKLLDACYNDAIPLDLLKAEQDRISRESHRTQQRLDSLDTDINQWHQLFTLAARLAGNCHAAYRAASDTTKRQLNHALFANITVRDGHIDDWQLHAPFDTLFNTTRFEYGSYV
ncbi:MAG: recombinase family protein, partial [Aldersonia sp.]|nr:recombinase family protein [Aldersonia sp.]